MRSKNSQNENVLTIVKARSEGLVPERTQLPLKFYCYISHSAEWVKPKVPKKVNYSKKILYTLITYAIYKLSLGKDIIYSYLSHILFISSLWVVALFLFLVLFLIFTLYWWNVIHFSHKIYIFHHKIYFHFMLKKITVIQDFINLKMEIVYLD